MPNDRRILRFASVAIVLGLALTGCKAKYPACEADRDCKDKEFCVDRKCQQCRNNWDCGHGFACNAGSCSPISGYCHDRSECPGGQECLPITVGAVSSTANAPAAHTASRALASQDAPATATALSARRASTVRAWRTRASLNQNPTNTARGTSARASAPIRDRQSKMYSPSRTVSGHHAMPRSSRYAGGTNTTAHRP